MLLLERVTESVRLQQQQALLVAALGGEAEVPDLQAELDAFEAALADDTPPDPLGPIDVEREELLQALGLPSRLGGG